MESSHVTNLVAVEPVDVDLPDNFIHRELSVLGFFKRVLAMAGDARHPLLERLRFLAICSTITDEFFEIRVAGLRQRIALGLDRVRPDGLGQVDALRQISQTVRDLVNEQYRLLNDEVLPDLVDEGICILKRKNWSEAQQEWIQDYFEEQVAPVLTPVGLDPAHPFPRVLNKSLNMMVALDGKDAFGRQSQYAVLPVPRCLPRIIPLPADVADTAHTYVLLSSVVHAHVGQVFPGMKIKGVHQFRVTRNADLLVEEDEIEDLLDALKGELFNRRYGDAVRLEVTAQCPEEEVKLLKEQFDLDEDAVFRVDGPVNLNRLDKLANLVDRPDLKYSPFVPSLRQAAPESDMFELLGRQDLLLHHPYESFLPVIELVRQAAADPSVLAIKQTVYRTGKGSPFVDALIKAARNGKEVTAIVELRARFDEAANIDLATRLQDAGAHVVYGVVGYKTHSKMLMIVRREGSSLRRYVHLGTGNYHAGNARLYTDFSFMTSREDICLDVHHLFMQLTGLGRAERLKKIRQAPFTLRKMLLKRLQFEANEAEAGRPAKVMLKVNSLSDTEMIKALYRASQSGVKIDLVIRGICCLKPGIEGLSENICVRSIVGRFLEHTRVYYFYAAGKEKVFCASADWMNRNLSRRVETCFPIEEKALKERVIAESLQGYLKDDLGAWALHEDGSYHKVGKPEDEDGFSIQESLLSKLAEQ